MKTHQLWALILALPVIVACGTQSSPAQDASVEAAAVTPRTLCDGSDDLRLFVFMSGGGPTEPARQVLIENGFNFILVDGHCRFWVKPDESIFETVRTGVLDAETLAEFVADFRYDRWPDLNRVGAYGTSLPDGGSVIFVDPETSITCQTVCSGPSTPPDVEAMRLANNAWNARLWSIGEAVTGDVRISVIESNRDPASLPPLWTPPLWPLSTPIASVVVSEADIPALRFGDGVLMTGADAEALRAMRRHFLDSGARRTGIGMLVHDDAGQLYEVNVRDTTPFEDERGLVAMPR
jgi:hypothetical protein